MSARKLVNGLLPVLLAACAAGPELRTLRASDTAVELEQVPFFAQQAYQCGPAALATVLLADGVTVTPEQLSPELYIPERQGSLQIELIAAARRHDRVPYLLPGKLAPILEELGSGRPVLVFQNLGLSRWPVWHYAVLIGFDPVKEHFILRSGDQRRYLSSARQFLASWDKAGRWAMVVSQANQPPATANAIDWIGSAAPFESTGQLDIASQAYGAARKRWPNEALSWAAQGNVQYRQQRFAAASLSYQQALQRDPELWTARNNLVQSLIDQGCPGNARSWVKHPSLPPPAVAEAWKKTLERLAASGDRTCALIPATVGSSEPFAFH